MCCICILFSKCINFRIIDRQKIVLSNYSKIYRFKDSSDSIIYVPRYCLVLLLYEPDFWCSGISENTTTWICQMIKMLKVVNIVFYDDCSRYWNVQDVFWWLCQSLHSSMMPYSGNVVILTKTKDYSMWTKWAKERGQWKL